MHIPIEDFVPFEQSVVWKIHDAYFAQRASTAWTSGEIPFQSTSHYVIARGHARLFCKLVDELEASGVVGREDSLEVLEVGCGLGRFAANFLRALERGCGPRGRELAPRLRYFLSDFSERTVREAAETPALAAAVASGRIVPALFDLRSPGKLRSLAGKALRPRLATVFASYVVCVGPVRAVRKTSAGYFEKFVRVSLEVADEDVAGRDPDAVAERLADPTTPELMKSLHLETEWRPAALEQLLPDALHAGTLALALEPFAEATVAYPLAWFEAMRALARRVLEGGLILVNDYGTCAREQMSGLHDLTPQHFGNTVNHGVSMALFDFFCPRAGLSCVRTEDVFRSVHVAAVRKAPEVGRRFRAAFRSIYRPSDADILDFRLASRACVDKGDHLGAARLLQRCIDLDDGDSELFLGAGEAALAARLPQHAELFLKRGRALVGERTLPFDRLLGRAYLEARRFALARRTFRAILARGTDAEAWAGLALIHAAHNQHRQAWRCCEEALAADPGHERAATLRSALARNRAKATLG